jgi:hypothetical protein
MCNVFLSYNSADRGTVRKIAQSLRNSEIKVWLDQDEIRPGTAWIDQLEDAIETCQAAAVFVGKDGEGPWERTEIRALLQEFVGRGLPVIPVWLHDSASEHPCLPLFLRQFHWIEYREGAPEQALKLLRWGITGVRETISPNSEKNEEQPAALDPESLCEQIFTPGSPVRDPRYLLGRLQELDDLQRIARRPGQHAVISGNRGVGKTSLARRFCDSFTTVAWRSCTPEDTFSSVFSDLLAQLNILDNGTRLTPPRILKQLKKISDKAILVIDEFDAIQKRNGSTMAKNVSSLMKMLSDHSDATDVRLAVVGVSRTAEDLLGTHESSQRCAREIYVKPLRKVDALEFLGQAEIDLGISFEPSIKSRLAGASLGYPYFLHLVGLETVLEMTKRTRLATNRTGPERMVCEADYTSGLEKALGQAMRAQLAKYRRHERKLNENEMKVVTSIALLDSSYPLRMRVLYECKKLFGMDDASASLALVALAQEKRLLFLTDRSDQVGFQDPLMKPFLREYHKFTRLHLSQGTADKAVSQRNLFE